MQVTWSVHISKVNIMSSTNIKCPCEECISFAICNGLKRQVTNNPRYQIFSIRRFMILLSIGRSCYELLEYLNLAYKPEKDRIKRFKEVYKL